MRIEEILFTFVLGGAGYVVIELLYRGRSHFSMAFAGGLSFLLLHLLFTRCPDAAIWVKCIAGMLVITSVEYLFGLVLNIKLKLGVWDYSRQRFNAFGQICLKFSLFWAVLSLPAAYISKLLHAFFT